MTQKWKSGDRAQAFIVTMDKDIHDEDVEAFVTALRMIRHVVKVEPVPIDTGDYLARERAKHELQAKMLDLLR